MRIVPLIEVELDCAPGSSVDYRESCGLPYSAVCTGALVELMLVAARELGGASIALRELVISGHSPIGDGLRLLGRAYESAIEVIGTRLASSEHWLRTDACAELPASPLGPATPRVVMTLEHAGLRSDPWLAGHVQQRAGGPRGGGWMRGAGRDATRCRAVLEVDACRLEDVSSYALHPLLWEAGVATAEVLLSNGGHEPESRPRTIRARGLSVYAPGAAPLRVELEKIEDSVTIRWIGQRGVLLAEAVGLVLGVADLDEPALRRAARIVEHTLGKRVADVQRPFAELGVSSIDRARVAAALALEFGSKPRLDDILDCASLAEVTRLFTRAPELPDALLNEREPESAARFSLSPAQRQVWALQALAPDLPRCHIHVRLRCSGPLDERAMAAAVDALIARHASLRTVMDCTGDEPLQRVADRLKITLTPIDLSHLAPEARQEALVRESDAQARAVFDLERGPLIRFALAKLAHDEHALLISAHHLIVDGFGLELLVRELLELYQSPEAFGGERLGLEHIAEPYVPRAATPNASGVFPARDAARRLPLARDPDGSGAGHGARAAIVVPVELRATAQRAQVSPFALLCAAYGYVLARHAAQDEVVIGVVSAARTTLEQLQAVGMFARSVPLRVAIDEDASLVAIAREIHARVPSLARDPDGSADSSPFAVTALFQQWGSAPLVAGALRFRLELDSPDGAPLGYCRSELELLAMDSGADVSACLQYDRSVFRANTMAWLATAMSNVLREVMAGGELALRALPTALAGDGLVLAGPRLADEVPLVHRSIADRARANPTAVAVRDAFGCTIGFGALADRAQAAGRALRELGAQPGEFVGIVASRVADLPVAVLAVLESGAAYVPIDPEHPLERIELALADTGVELVIALEPTALTFSRARVVGLDALAARGAGLPDTPFTQRASDAAYVLHTSGSTGKPKGVIVEHASLANFVRAMERLLPAGAHGPWLALTTLAFDISIVELLYALAMGAEVRVGSAPSLRSHESEPFAVLRELGRGVRSFQCTPSLARLMLSDPDGRGFLEGLTILLVGGEALPLWLARALCERVPGAVLNMYGPTETTVWSAAARLDPDAAWVPIGLPIANTTLRVVDEAGRDVAKGLSGELWIGGDGVARGYMMRPDETAARFVRDERGVRFYRTGDLVRARELCSGEIALEWLGRIDRQIKLAGNRIELSEVEGVVAQHPFARDCAVLVEALAGEERLVAVVVPDDASMADAGTSSDAVTGIYSAAEIEGALLAWAAQKVPQYMVPARIVLVDALPQTASGKTDRRALAALVARRPPPESLKLGERPVTREEKLLAELWTEVLARPEIGRYDDFFALGGTSFSAVLLASRARKRGVALPPAVVLAYPTLAEQALQISAVVVQREAKALQEEAKLEPLQGAAASAQWPPRRIVLTGATGFLGAHLLVELQASLDAEVVCLVRAEDDDAARERLRRCVNEWGLGERVQWSLTRCVAADLKLPHFGLSADDWRFLSEHSDLVLHNAAEVNFALAYEELRATNVIGTRTALALAAEGVRKPFHYVSTIAITDASKAGERVDEDSSLVYSERLLDGYSQSKWVAESLVRLAGEQGLDVTCYRAGPLIADRAPKGDAFAEALATVARTGVAFSTGARFIPHLSRVDDTARAIITLCLSRARGIRVEHVVSPQRVAIADLLAWVREWGFEVKELSDQEWLERIDAEPWAAATMFVVSQRLRDGLPLVPEVEHGATLVRLSSLGFTWREIDGVLIQRLIARLTGSAQSIRPSEVG